MTLMFLQVTRNVSLRVAADAVAVISHHIYKQPVIDSRDICLVSRLSRDVVFHSRSWLMQSQHLYLVLALFRISVSRHVSCLMIVH